MCIITMLVRCFFKKNCFIEITTAEPDDVVAAVAEFIDDILDILGEPEAQAAAAAAAPVALVAAAVPPPVLMFPPQGLPQPGATLSGGGNIPASALTVRKSQL